MRFFTVVCLIFFSATQASALDPKSMKVAETVALIEWANERCNIKPPFDISDMLATVMSENLHGWVLITRTNLENLHKRHGREDACKAAAKAVSKIQTR